MPIDLHRVRKCTHNGLEFITIRVIHLFLVWVVSVECGGVVACMEWDGVVVCVWSGVGMVVVAYLCWTVWRALLGEHVSVSCVGTHDRLEPVKIHGQFNTLTIKTTDLITSSLKIVQENSAQPYKIT